MDEMTLPCPHCGGELTIHAPPDLGEIEAPQTGAKSLKSPQIPEIEGEVLDLDLEPKSSTKSEKQSKTYNKDYPSNFLKFWRAYPLKRGKRNALLAWRRALKRASAEEIEAGAVRYRDDPNRDESYTKYAEGWLNGDGWEDEALPKRASNGQRPDPPRPLDPAMEAALEELGRYG